MNQQGGLPYTGLRSRGELSITHSQANLRASNLAQAFGPNAPAALNGSWVQAAGLTANILFSADRGAYRLYCMRVSASRLDVFVEPGNDPLVAACNHVWSEIRRALRDLNPRLETAGVYDESGKRARVGRVDFISEFWRREIMEPALVAVLSALIGIGVAVTQNRGWIALVAATPAMVNGLRLVVWAGLYWRRQTIRWMD